MTLDEFIVLAISRIPDSKEVQQASERLGISKTEFCDLVARTVAERFLNSALPWSAGDTAMNICSRMRSMVAIQMLKTCQCSRRVFESFDEGEYEHLGEPPEFQGEDRTGLLLQTVMSGSTGAPASLSDDVARPSPALAVGGFAEINGFYERSYRRPGGGAIEATLEHRDILVAALVDIAPGRDRRFDAIWSAGLGLARSTTCGTIVTTGPFLPPTPPRGVSIVEYGVVVLGGAYLSVRVSPHTRVLGGAAVRWISRPRATRREGIGSFGVTPRIGLSVTWAA